MSSISITACKAILGNRFEETQGENGVILLSRMNNEEALNSTFTASELCLANRNRKGSDIDLIISASLVNKYISPGNSSLIAKHIGATGSINFNIEAGCAAIFLALYIAEALAARFNLQNVLLTFTSSISSVLQCDSSINYYGDFSGAILLERKDTKLVLRDTRLLSLANLATDKVVKPKEESECWLTGCSGHTISSASGCKISSRFSREAYSRLPQLIRDLLSTNALSVEDISLFLLHQSSLTLKWAQQLGINKIRCPYLYPEIGNLGMGNIPYLLSQLFTFGRFHPKDLLVLAGTGLGWKVGAALFEWQV